jgi:hypothetical protein
LIHLTPSFLRLGIKAVAATDVIKIDAKRFTAMLVAWNRSLCSEKETKMPIAHRAPARVLNARECVFDVNFQQECGFHSIGAGDHRAPFTMERGKSYKVVRS